MDVVRADLAVEEIEGKSDPLVYTMVAGDELRKLGEKGQIYTDDRPTLEFTAPRTRATPDENLARIAQNLTPLTDLFDLTDPVLVADLEQLRRLTLQVSARGADVKDLTERIEAVRKRVYAEPDSTRIDESGETER